ncbi:MAG: HDOD domain-containing protein [Gammaproteobacteria bacterium]|jgi:HD-like signal output (HDOD) protein
MATPDIAPELLDQLDPILHLSANGKKMLLTEARVDLLERGRKLPSSNEESTVQYLLEGELALISGEKVVERITPEDSNGRAMLPIFTAGNTADAALALHPVRVLSVSRSALEKMLTEESVAGMEVREDTVSEVEGGLLQRLYQAMHDGGLPLPIMPEIAINIRELAQDPDAELADLAKAVQAAPPVVAKLIQAANSAANRGTKSVDSVREAVTRLGLKRSANLAVSIVLGNIYKVRTPAVEPLMRREWLNSVEVSAVANVLARIAPGIDPERALLAGLMHAIGAVPILTFSEELDPSLEDLEQALTRLTPIVGGTLLQNWGFEPEFVQAAEESGNWERDSGAALDLCDVVLLARMCVNLHAPQPMQLPDITSVPAFAKLKLDNPSAEELMQHISEADQDIAEIREFLS